MTTISLTSEEVAELTAGILHRIRLHGFAYGTNPNGSYRPNPTCDAILQKIQDGEGKFVDSKPLVYKSGSNF